jgi:Protein of unknown function (DUF1822)
MTLLDLTLTELTLAIELDVQERSWQASQIEAAQSTAGSGWQIYLNQLCLETLLPWLQDEPEPEAQVWPDRAAAATLWRVVNGTALTLKADTTEQRFKRLVLIPDKSLETDALRVPQEWVDLPSWSGDYYLAVQVNPEGDALRVWGYATHEQLKQGEYDPSDRAYILPALQMVTDLNALWVVRQLNPQEPTQAAIAPIAAMSDAELTAFRPQSGTTPRLNLPLPQWNAFLERADRASQLDAIFTAPSPKASAPTQLSQWFDGLFANTWEAIDALLGSQPDLALSFRKAVQADDPQFSLQTKVRRAKLLPLAADQRVLLLLSLEHEADGRIGVRVQLLPADRAQPLPIDLQLLLLSGSGNVVQSVAVPSPAQRSAQSPDPDNLAPNSDAYIRLKLFRCAPGTRFAIQVATPGFSVIEQFVS